MLLMHVTKDGNCAYCAAGVVKCAESTCQLFFHPTNSRHIYCRPRCKMRCRRNKLKTV